MRLKAFRYDRVLQKVSDKEPIFVLRAQDESAPATVRYWVEHNPQLSKERREEALALAQAMAAWPSKKRAD